MLPSDPIQQRRLLTALSVCALLVALAFIKVVAADEGSEPVSGSDQAQQELAEIEGEIGSATEAAPLPIPGEAPDVLVSGDPAPEFALETLDGEPVSLEALEGEPVVLEFAATWCPHCRAMAPIFDSVASDHPDVNYVIVGAAGESDKDLRSWHESFLGKPMAGEVANDPDYTTTRAYSVAGYPTTVFIDRDGVVADVVAGELSASRLDALFSSIE